MPLNEKHGAFELFPLTELLTQTKVLDDGAVALDVALLQVVEQGAALADELSQRTGGHIVLVVSLHVLSEVSDAIGEQCNLALCRTRVLGVLAILTEDLGLLVFV